MAQLMLIFDGGIQDARLVEAALRIPLMVLWPLLILRAYLYSWNVVHQPPEIRAQAWRYFRIAWVVMGFAVAGFYSPAPILVSLNHLSPIGKVWMVNIGSMLNIACVCLLLVGLDIVNRRGNKYGFIYIWIACLLVLAGLYL